MCGRYTIIRGDKIVGVVQNVTVQADLHFLPRWNVAPTQMVPAVLNTAGRDLRMVRWGLIPSWAKDAKMGGSLINARAETLAEKPAFRAALKYRRCLLPADGFYEWRKDGAGKKAGKTPMFIRMRDGGAFAFAGLWEEWRDPAGAVVASCTIVTTTANALMAGIHDRMPVIVAAGDYGEWLEPAAEGAEGSRWLRLLKPYPAEGMEAYAVSSRVNSAKVEGAELVERVVERAEEEPRQGLLF